MTDDTQHLLNDVKNVLHVLNVVDAPQFTHDDVLALAQYIAVLERELFWCAALVRSEGWALHEETATIVDDMAERGKWPK